MIVQRARLMMFTLSVACLFGLTGCDKMKSALGGEDSARAPDAATTKFIAYGKAQADLAELHPFDQEIVQYAEYNPDITGKGPIEVFSAVSNPFGSAIHLLQEAMAIKADLGPLDTSAARMLAAVQALNPTVKEMRTYSDAKGVLNDGGAKARQLDPIYRAQMKEATAAEREFAGLLSARSEQLDTARLGTLKPDSVEYHALNTNLATRHAVDALSGLTEDPTDASRSAFVARLVPVRTADQAFASAIAAYKGTLTLDHCKTYQAVTAKLAAAARDVAASPKAKIRGGTRSEKFVDQYNETIADYNRCVADLHPGAQDLHL